MKRAISRCSIAKPLDSTITFRSSVRPWTNGSPVNQRRWDEMAKFHQQTYFSDDARFSDESLKPFEVDEIGNIRVNAYVTCSAILGASRWPSW